MDDVGEWLGSLVSSPLIPVFQAKYEVIKDNYSNNIG